MLANISVTIFSFIFATCITFTFDANYLVNHCKVEISMKFAAQLYELYRFKLALKGRFMGRLMKGGEVGW